MESVGRVCVWLTGASESLYFIEMHAPSRIHTLTLLSLGLGAGAGGFSVAVVLTWLAGGGACASQHLQPAATVL